MNYIEHRHFVLDLTDRIPGPDMRCPYFTKKTRKKGANEQLEHSSGVIERMDDHNEVVGAEELYTLRSCQGSICERQGGHPVKVPNGTRPKFS